MKKVLSILALALALVACTDKPQWEPAAPSQPVITSLTLDTAKEFSSNTLNRTELYHVNGQIVKLSLEDITDYEVVSQNRPYNESLLIGISAAQIDSKDAENGVLDCEIACVGTAHSLDAVKATYEALLAAEQAPAPAPEDTPDTPDTTSKMNEETPGEGEGTPEPTPEPTPEEIPDYVVTELEWNTHAIVPTTSTVAEEKESEKDPNVYKAPQKWGYVIRYTDVTGQILTYAVLVDSYDITEAIVENVVELPNAGADVTTIIPEYSYSCVAGIKYKMFDAQGWK